MAASFLVQLRRVPGSGPARVLMNMLSRKPQPGDDAHSAGNARADEVIE
jgi:hypothetical protein